MLPCCGLYRPLTLLSMLVLPAPFGPIMARISDCRASRDTPERAVTPPKLRCNPSTANCVSPEDRAMAGSILDSVCLAPDIYRASSEPAEVGLRPKNPHLTRCRHCLLYTSDA